MRSSLTAHIALGTWQYIQGIVYRIGDRAGRLLCLRTANKSSRTTRCALGRIPRSSTTEAPPLSTMS